MVVSWARLAYRSSDRPGTRTSDFTDSDEVCGA
jgi:hypothetical protein